MRIDYTQNPPETHSAEEQRIVEKVKECRGITGLDLLPVDLTLLHAPQIAEGWHALFGAIRHRSSLPDDIREIAICRTGLINRAWYEWGIHSAILLESENFNEEKLFVVKQANPTSPGPLDDRQWATLRYADAITRHVTVSQDIFDAVKAVGFTQQQIVELTATIAGYNMVSRFLVSLDIAEVNNKAPEWVDTT
ncbi:AhpD-like protein [Pyrenochaeta sp. MPI-SDFR-AT-0127]|nr:AhpD-like protein [Pyrenochaeta sp. MPI-SDFR-AT-0127]